MLFHIFLFISFSSRFKLPQSLRAALVAVGCFFKTIFIRNTRRFQIRLPITSLNLKQIKNLKIKLFPMNQLC